ncbi:hypothetical protein IWX50DRAFT_676844 [Phyllosticta citricarpa]
MYACTASGVGVAGDVQQLACPPATADDCVGSALLGCLCAWAGRNVPQRNATQRSTADGYMHVLLGTCLSTAANRRAAREDGAGQQSRAKDFNIHAFAPLARSAARRETASRAAGTHPVHAVSLSVARPVSGPAGGQLPTYLLPVWIPRGGVSTFQEDGKGCQGLPWVMHVRVTVGVEKEREERKDDGVRGCSGSKCDISPIHVLSMSLFHLPEAPVSVI